MVLVNEEGLAGIRLMICMAKADGILSTDERHILEEELSHLVLPENKTMDELFAENQDPKVLADQVKSSEARAYIFASVFAIAHCDNSLASEEQEILSRLRSLWQIKPDDEASWIRTLKIQPHAEPPQEALPSVLSDAPLRNKAFERITMRYCFLTALTGAIPVPLIPDLLVIPMQGKMIYDIANLFGLKTDKKTVQLMFETMGVGTGVRVGISMLSKMVPGWGSVVGATSSFATTYALARVAFAYYKSEGKVPMESLKPLFKEQQKQGKVEYQKQKATLDEAHRTHADSIKQLAKDFSEGKITASEYEHKMDQLN
jgi:uncharacterized protein (DUF697 family)